MFELLFQKITYFPQLTRRQIVLAAWMSIYSIKSKENGLILLNGIHKDG